MTGCANPRCTEELDGVVVSVEIGDMFNGQFMPDSGGSMEMHPECAVKYIQQHAQ